MSPHSQPETVSEKPEKLPELFRVLRRLTSHCHDCTGCIWKEQEEMRRSLNMERSPGKCSCRIVGHRHLEGKSYRSDVLLYEKLESKEEITAALL